MITVLGKLKDTLSYIDKPGYNVYGKRDDWTPSKNRQWLLAAVLRGDQFLIVSTEMTGQFLSEILDLLSICNSLHIERERSRAKNTTAE